MSTYSIYIMQLYDSIYNLMLVVRVLTVSYLFVAYMNHALLIASIPQAYGIFILNLRHSNLEATVLLTYHGRGRNSSWLWEDLSTAMVGTRHGRDESVIP